MLPDTITEASLQKNFGKSPRSLALSEPHSVTKILEEQRFTQVSPQLAAFDSAAV